MVPALYTPQKEPEKTQILPEIIKEGS